MALQVLIGLSQENSCGALVINDITGEYNSGNLTGWKTATSGGTNMRIDNSSITVALLTITGSTFSHTFNLMTTAIWQALTPYTTGLPFDSSVVPAGLSYTLTSADLGGGLPDGIITVELYLEDNSSATSDNTFTVALYCKAKCCRDKIMVAIPDYYQCQKCNNEYIDIANVVDGLYKALLLAACSADLSRFSSILSTLQNIYNAMNLTC